MRKLKVKRVQFNSTFDEVQHEAKKAQPPVVKLQALKSRAIKIILSCKEDQENTNDNNR